MALEHVAPGRVVALTSWGEPQTQALVKARHFEALRVWLEAGKQLPEHKVHGAVTVQCISGRAKFSSGGSTEIMVAGDWLHLEGGTLHTVHALTNSVLLVMILLTPPQAPADSIRPTP